jgi:hypothetical protein
MSIFNNLVVRYSLLFSMIIVLGCTSAIGVRNPNYDKKIKNIAILDFTGPGDLGQLATEAFIKSVNKLDVVGVYQPYQIREFLQQQGLREMDPGDLAARKLLAEKLKIDAFFGGQVIQYNNTRRTAGNIELTVRLTDIENAGQIYSATVRTDGAGILTGEEYEIIEASIDAIISDIKSQFSI